MRDYNFQDELVAQKITAEDVEVTNTMLCITNNYLEVNFEEDAWEGIATKIITSCRKIKGNN